MESDNLYIDEPCVAFFHFGELGWGLSRWFGHMRYLHKEVYKDKPFVAFIDLDYHIFVKDFVKYSIELPEWFYKLELERDCYEAVLPDSKPGSLTPPHVYSRMIEYMRGFYDYEKCIEIFPPRGCNPFVTFLPQLFRLQKEEPIKSDRDIICVMPRGRSRAPQRNVPEFIWREVVEELRKYFTVVLCGTPSGSFLLGYTADNVINLIDYNKEDKMDLIVRYLNSAVCSISSQSGLTHVSLHAGCPSYIIGHEKERHVKFENKFDVPVSFRTVVDYRAIDSQTILNDVAEMLNLLEKARQEETAEYVETLSNSCAKLNSIIEGV